MLPCLPVVRHACGLRLDCSADGEQVLVAVVGAVQVVAVLRIPEIDLDASGADDVLVAGRGSAVEPAAENFTLPPTKSPQ